LRNEYITKFFVRSVSVRSGHELARAKLPTQLTPLLKCNFLHFFLQKSGSWPVLGGLGDQAGCQKIGDTPGTPSTLKSWGPKIPTGCGDII